MLQFGLNNSHLGYTTTTTTWKMSAMINTTNGANFPTNGKIAILMQIQFKFYRIARPTRTQGHLQHSLAIREFIQIPLAHATTTTFHLSLCVEEEDHEDMQIKSSILIKIAQIDHLAFTQSRALVILVTYTSSVQIQNKFFVRNIFI